MSRLTGKVFNNDKIVDDKISNYLSSINHIKPVQVVSINNNNVNVKLLSQMFYEDENGDYQPLENDTLISIPVLNLNGIITATPKENDKGLILCCDEEINSVYKNEKYTLNRFALHNAVYIPLAQANSDTDTININTPAKFKVSNGSDDLIKELYNALNEFNSKLKSSTQFSDFRLALIPILPPILDKINKFIK